MNPITLSLITAYLDSLQRRVDFRAPHTPAQLEEFYYRYYWRISPTGRPYFPKEN